MDKTMKEARCTYIEAMLLICERRGLDVETIPELLTPKLKKRVQVEARNLNLMKKKAVKS
jgi:hypothetical protein